MLIEYVWVDSAGNTRSKTRIVYQKTLKKEDIEIPYWTYDGSSTGQADGNSSEVILKPQSIFADPFRGGDSLIALCDTYTPDMKPHPSNTRHIAQERFAMWPDCTPIFGIEQEFFLMKGDRVLAQSTIEGDKDDLEKLSKQGDYYCGCGSNNAMGREVVEAAFKRAIMAGIHVTGLNAEVAPSQWEIQLDAEGINAGDQLIVLRYILNRTAEMFGTWVNYHPKPLSGDWNGSGCHVNFSTSSMRNDDGYKDIISAIEKLGKNHSKHMESYGLDNDKHAMTA